MSFNGFEPNADSRTRPNTQGALYLNDLFSTPACDNDPSVHADDLSEQSIKALNFQRWIFLGMLPNTAESRIGDSGAININKKEQRMWHGN